MIIQANINNFPDYIKSSGLYSAFEEEDKEYKIDSDDTNYHFNLDIVDMKSYIQFYKLLDYWSVNELPDNFLEYTSKLTIKEFESCHFENNLFYKCLFKLVKKEYLFNDLKTYEVFPSIIKYMIRLNNNHNCLIYLFNLECFKYAHENGCYWNSLTCSFAAQEGKLDCLKYAIDNGCDYGEYLYSNASGSNNLQCLKYIVENGYVVSKIILHEIHDLEILKYVHKCGFKLDSSMLMISVLDENLPMVEYLIENGVKDYNINEWYSNDDFENSFFYAALRNNYEIFIYLYNNIYPKENENSIFDYIPETVFCIFACHLNKEIIEFIINEGLCLFDFIKPLTNLENFSNLQKVNAFEFLLDSGIEIFNDYEFNYNKLFDKYEIDQNNEDFDEQIEYPIAFIKEYLGDCYVDIYRKHFMV
jgi:hypothetical protein